MKGRARGLVAAVGILLLMAGCAADKAPPAPLLPVTPTIAGKQVWQQRLDTRVGFPLAVVVRQGQVIAASDQGVVQGLDLATGKEVWRANVKNGLSAGVGSDGRFSAVVTRDNELVTIEAGAERWRKSLDARVVTAPLVAGERVFVVGVDRAVHAYDALDGRKLWTLRRAGDPLTLAQASVLTAYKDTLIVGQGPRLLGVDSLRGTVRWEAVVATPRGTNEVERLADLIGPAARVGSSFCVRAFQSSIGCVDAERGALQWSINGGGTQPVAADADQVFSADAVDRVSARRRSDGVLLWSNERFLNRELSGPVSVGKTVVFGDFEGQVHFLSRETGLTLLRLPTDGSAVVGAPIVADTTLLVVTRNGGLFAFRPE